jgi:hypothetical protein
MHLCLPGILCSPQSKPSVGQADPAVQRGVDVENPRRALNGNCLGVPQRDDGLIPRFSALAARASIKIRRITWAAAPKKCTRFCRFHSRFTNSGEQRLANLQA